MKNITIGIPRSLLYFRYHQLWQAFFQELNCKIVISPPTNRQIFNDGINLSVDENCLSVKVYLGHINYLKDKADYILVPRIVTVYKNEQSCRKFSALYDNIVNTFKNIKLIEYTVDVENGETEFIGFFKAGLKINKNPFKVISAYIKAKNRHKEFNNQMIKDQKKLMRLKDKDLTILIVAHPYVIRDIYIGRPIVQFLEKEGVRILYSDVINSDIAKKRSKKISTDIYWTESMEFIGAIDYHKKHIDGIIYVTVFSCGPDGLVVDLCQKKIKNIPSIMLVIDELQSEIGLVTRLESFIDILRMKKQKNEKK